MHFCIYCINCAYRINCVSSYQICELLVPQEIDDDSDAILEVTAGVGGQEAMLFTKEVFEMYLNYAAAKAGVGLSLLITSMEDAELGNWTFPA